MNRFWGVVAVAMFVGAIAVMGQGGAMTQETPSQQGSSSVQGIILPDIGTISGSLQTDAQTSRYDAEIGADTVRSGLLSSTYFNLLFTRGKFTAGIRFESYQPPILGIDPRYGSSGDGTGLGIPYRFATYADDVFEVTAGNFYEQFGSGMILRTYEERNLGFDNSLDGLRLRFMPTAGLQLTGFIGRQRAFWDLSAGIMRGADASADLKTMLGDALPDDMQLSVGASVVSRYQADDQEVLKIPENVLAWSTRANVMISDLSVDLEYAYKINDPSATNKLSFNPGNALYLNASWAGNGIGVNFATKRIDNMDFRSDRTAEGLVQQVNYLPALTKQHTWRLITLYPYATQPTGEFGMQGDVSFTIPKGSFLGDDETLVTLNASVIHELDTTHVDAFTYDAKFGWDDRIYYRDVNIEITRKFGRDFKVTLAYINLDYDKDIIERLASSSGTQFGVITANFAVVELWFKLSKTNSLRTELQYMTTKQQPGTKLAPINGDWAMALVEYSISPHWILTAFNELNFNSYKTLEDGSLQEQTINYPSAQVAYNTGALRVSGGYGRVRGGILCVGGICRPVPASNGFTLSVMYSF